MSIVDHAAEITFWMPVAVIVRLEPMYKLFASLRLIPARPAASLIAARRIPLPISG